jgi:hypothetical protein
MLKTALITRRFVSLAGDRHGMVLQETDFILPVLITMILAGFDVARLALLQQKLSRMVMATSNMVSQGTTISIPEINTIFNASSTMVWPFGTGASQIMIVSSVSAVGAAAPKVDWRRTGGGTLADMTSKIGIAGANATLPPGFLVRNGENAIIGEVYYQFSPMFVPATILPSTLYHRAVFRPRQSSLTNLCASPC